MRGRFRPPLRPLASSAAYPSPSPSPPRCPPRSAAVSQRLYAHQVEGVRWLWGLHRLGKGGILADDMG